MEFLYLDRQVAVAVKPPGIPTQEAAGHTFDFTHQVMEAIKEKEGREKVFLHPVHRLDAPTSGIVLFARTSKALSRLQHSFRQKEMSKSYIAEVEGHLLKEQGSLEHYLVHRSHRAEISSRNDPEAKHAILHYKVLEKRQKTTLVQIDLETGRYHQIRCQFSHIGHPVVGDQKYGSAIASDRLHLHHTLFTFTHPISHEEITLESAPPF